MDKTQSRKICFKKLEMVQNKRARDQQISEKVLEIIKDYDSVGIYCAFRNEIVLELEFDNLYYPVVDGKAINFYRAEYGFKTSKFGIDEPIIIDQIPVVPDVLIVPCVGFYNNYRLGYGGGYYDRYLEINKVFTVGIAYKECELEVLAISDYDLPLDKIIVG